jgi:hypothetical protein
MALGEYFFSFKLLSVLKIECRNAGEIVSPASLVFPLVLCVSPASALRYRRQSGTTGHGLVR